MKKLLERYENLRREGLAYANLHPNDRATLGQVCYYHRSFVSRRAAEMADLLDAFAKATRVPASVEATKDPIAKQTFLAGTGVAFKIVASVDLPPDILIIGGKVFRFRDGVLTELA